MHTVISVKVDKEVKDAAQAVAKSMGLTLSTLINAYLIQVTHSRRVELFAPEQMSPKLEKLIGKIEKEVAAGQVSDVYTDPKEFLASLKRG